MVSPLLPVFAEDMGASGVWLGLAFSGFAFTQVPLMPVVGRFSDRFGKKPFVWVGLLIYAAAAVGYFWSPSYHELVIFRVVSGIGAAMVIPTSFAYVGELAPLGYEARYMSIFNIALIAGFGIGPVLGGTVHDAFGMDAAFLSMAVLSAMGLIVVVVFLPGHTSSPAPTASHAERAHGQSPGSFVSALRQRAVRGIVAFQLAYGVLFGTVLAFIGIWMTDRIETTVAQVGIVLAARVIVNGTMAYPFGWLADRMDRVMLASIGMVVLSMATFSVPWVGHFALLLGLFVMMGIFESMAMPSVNAITVEAGRTAGMGSVMGLFNMAMSLGLVLGSLVGGVVDNSMGIAAVFRCAAGFGLVGVVFLNAFMPKSARLSRQSLRSSIVRRS